MSKHFENEKSIGVLTSANRSVPFYLYEFIKTFLFAVYSNRLVVSDFSVVRMAGKADPTNPKPQQLSVVEEVGSPYLRVSSALVDASADFGGALYDICLHRVNQRGSGELFNYVDVLGMNPGATLSNELLDLLIKESIRISPYRSAFLEVASPVSDWQDGFFVTPIELKSETIDEIFLPQGVQDHLSLFIHSLVNYDTIRKSFRLLLAGKPGTGKTKIIRAIASACKGKATFIFTNGNEDRIKSLFDFVDLFSPVVLCIDDIDLMMRSREEGTYSKHLSDFLQKLDGFVNRDFFLLATTNDKRLVDLAASRPGRFDLIIDVNLIHPEHYLRLVQNKSDNKEVVALFNEEVLLQLEQKKVSGAFIANLVKHLELVSTFSREKLNAEYVLNILRESHQGFYNEPETVGEKFGFAN